MKKLLFALAALAAFFHATPDFAQSAPARLLLITPRTPGTNSDANPGAVTMNRVLDDYTKILDKLGVYYEIHSQSQIPTIDALTGKYYYASYGTRTGPYTTFDVVWSTGWWKYQDWVGENPAAAPYVGTNRDSLTRYSMWDGASGRPTNSQRVIQIITGNTGFNVGVTNAWSNAASCSTGVSGYTMEGKFDPNRAQSSARTNFLSGSAIRWRTGNTSGEYSHPVALASSMPGILRNVIGQRQNAAGLAESAPSTSWRRVNCDDCDSLQSAEGSVPDTSVLWARYMFAGDKAPVIYNNPANGFSGGAGSIDFAAVVGALAMADSLLGNRLIGQKPLWEPIKAAAFVSGNFQRNMNNNNPLSGQSRGLTIASPSTDVDTVRYKQVVRDSLRSLGIHYTFTLNPDSATVYRNELNWYADLQGIRFMPVSTTGLFTGTGSSMGRASKYHTPDPFGGLRTRSVGWYGQPCSNFTDDTTTTCLLKWMFQRTDSIVPGRTCYAIYAPTADFLGTAIGQRGTGSLAVDSWAAAMWWAGARVVVQEVDNVSYAPNSGATVNGAGQAIAANDWLGYFGSYRKFPVYMDSLHTGQQLGNLTFVTTQLNSDNNPSKNLDYVHSYANDFLTGLFCNLRYQNEVPFYYHIYRTRNNVYRIDAGSLAGTSPTGWPRRWGWWSLKSAVNPTRVINKLAGRDIVKWVYVDEL